MKKSTINSRLKSSTLDSELGEIMIHLDKQ